MITQFAIVVMIDVEGVLSQGTLTDNVYLIDNARSAGSEGEGTSGLITQINGVYGPSGAQTIGQGLNWVAYDISDYPPTLPQAFFVPNPLKQIQNAIRRLQSANSVDAVTSLVAKLRATSDREQDLVRSYGPSMAQRLIFMQSPEPGMLKKAAGFAHIPPVIYRISGPAVDNHVIYPAQYGSPDLVSEGWYWSASVDTSKIGVHAYNIHLILHRPVGGNDDVVWTPEEFVFETKLRIAANAQINGFTGAGLWQLPLPCVCAQSCVSGETAI